MLLRITLASVAVFSDGAGPVQAGGPFQAASHGILLILFFKFDLIHFLFKLLLL
jgi:hypothetical protein